MANKQDLPGYMDNVPVKISERYKPPRKINLAISYPQKLMLNRIIQESPSYDFSLETNVLQKISEWKSLRKSMAAERLERQERLKQIELKRVDESSNRQDRKGTTESATPENSDITTDIKSNYITKQENLLYPTTHNHILTPILLKTSDTVSHKLDSTDRSPFNISDFEADNSSPFDNMELKTINDMAELAQVLQHEESTNKPCNSYAQTTNCYNSYGTTNTYTTSYKSENCLENNQRVLNYYGSPQQSSYLPSNQLPTADQYYKYMVNDIPQVQNSSRPEYNNVDVSPPQITKTTSKSSSRSVPDIVKALQNELDNTHIDLRAKVTNQNSVDQFENCYYNLPVSLQQLATKVSSMGFPLPRVAKVVHLIGDDQKKVVDHLLVMTELLDLGFQEEAVSKALLQCNNDRDKAIDTLIS